MEIENVDRETLKSVITEILLENPGYFKKVLVEIMEEHQLIESSEEDERTSKLRKMIQDDFDQYEDVFQSLA